MMPSVVQFLLMLLLVGSILRYLTYMLLQSNPDSLLGKYLAMVY